MSKKTCLRDVSISVKNKKGFCFTMKVENTNWSVLVATDTLKLWILLPATDASCASLWHVWTPHFVLVYFSGSPCCIQSVILSIVNSWCLSSYQQSLAHVSLGVVLEEHMVLLQLRRHSLWKYECWKFYITWNLFCSWQLLFLLYWNGHVCPLAGILALQQMGRT